MSQSWIFTSMKNVFTVIFFSLKKTNRCSVPIHIFGGSIFEMLLWSVLINIWERIWVFWSCEVRNVCSLQCAAGNLWWRPHRWSTPFSAGGDEEDTPETCFSRLNEGTVASPWPTLLCVRSCRGWKLQKLQKVSSRLQGPQRCFR